MAGCGVCGGVGVGFVVAACGVCGGAGVGLAAFCGAGVAGAVAGAFCGGGEVGTAGLGSGGEAREAGGMLGIGLPSP